MEKGVTYTYDRRRYTIDVLLATYVSVVGLPLAVVLLSLGVLAPLMLLLAVVCGYSLLNAFVAHAYPRKVTFDGSSVAFESFGHVDSYPAGSIERLRVQRYPDCMRLYLRVNNASPLRGRYFLHCEDLYDPEGNNAGPVYDFLLKLAGEASPAQGKASRGR
ncbi:MAG: hypothetical protein DUD33_08070 [Coriobacteriaceae bacterium]|jgi:hypothetical protein|nr:MAG: hypothetical protein DUD33_08070 [Coriobacteriaceae bacterium]